MADDKPEGLRGPGNINLNGRPLVANSDGSYSSEKSFSRGTDKGEVLVPQIVNGKTLNQDDAWDHYKKTGEHMGVFDTPEHADAYAGKVHNRKLTDSKGKPNYEAEAAIHPPVSHTKMPYALVRSERKKEGK
jgi:hypothetical protein